jgi:N-acetylglucosamine kinase-like BadF-type ATPase
MEYVIGADAGGTKTGAALYDENGRALYETSAGYGNMLVNKDGAVRNIIAAVAGCVSACPSSAKPHIYVGAAGISAEGNAPALEAALKARFPGCSIRVESDAIMALYALTGGGDGILVIAGTGSIAYGKLGCRQMKIGGWGNILGDEGSGYYIARRSFSNITAEHDAGAGYGLLSRRLLKKLGTEIRGMVKFVYSADKGEIAAFLPVVEQAAADGDKTAAALLAEAGGHLASLAGSLRARLGFKGRTTVVIKGGVLEKTEAVRNEFINRLDDGKFLISLKSAPAELGAYYLHFKNRA